jgi:hypothetical protein
MRTETGCGHFGEHQVLEVYPDDRGAGKVLILEFAPEIEPANVEAVQGVIHTVKVKCLTCGHVSLMPVTFPN